MDEEVLNGALHSRYALTNQIHLIVGGGGVHRLSLHSHVLGETLRLLRSTWHRVLRHGFLFGTESQ